MVWCVVRKEKLYHRIRTTLYHAVVHGSYGVSMTDVQGASSYYLRLRSSGVPREEAVERTVRQYPPVVYHASTLWRILVESDHELPMTARAFFRLQRPILGHDPHFHREGDGWTVNGWAARDPDDPYWHRPVLKGIDPQHVDAIRKRAHVLRRRGATQEAVMRTLMTEYGIKRTMVWDIIHPKGRYREVGSWPESPNPGNG